MTVRLGIDVGSVSVSVAAVAEDGTPGEAFRERHQGNVLATCADLLGRLRATGCEAAALAATGAGAAALVELGADSVLEVIALERAVGLLRPDWRTVVEVGGANSKLISLAPDEDRGVRVEDFAINALCAAGAGAFMDEQAARFGMTTHEFGELALASDSPARVAGRCSVFAKSDMIHLQQRGVPKRDIAAGLCRAFATNFRATVARGKAFTPPVAFLGGAAANRGLVRAFEDALGLARGAMIAPRRHAVMVAIGAALCADSRSVSLDSFIDRLRERARVRVAPKAPLAPLRVESSVICDSPAAPAAPAAHAPADVWLGIDVGSISTKAVAIDRDKRLVAKSYLLTGGDPVRAVKAVLRDVAAELSRRGQGRLRVRGAATTGSGRYLIGDIVGADVVKNEITAQAAASAWIDPRVDTVFEIGGQDSKFISLRGGVVVDFEMNKVCAAGTGSFLEEQAERLGIRIEAEFAALALSAAAPVDLGERCAVFMQTNLCAHQQRGASREDLAAGLAYSIAQNYLNRVVGRKLIGERIFFQGAVAQNTAVVAAFEKLLGRPITVPPHPDVTGAWGAALVALEEAAGDTRFRGFEAIADAPCVRTAFECDMCPNHCEITRVQVKDEAPLFYGGRCERYERLTRKARAAAGRSGAGPAAEIPDLFAEYESALLERSPEPGDTSRPTVGMPFALTFHELYPFWRAFFREIGFDLVPSGATTRSVTEKGLESVVTETCFPVKVAHGHVCELLDKGVEAIFIPRLVDWERRTGYERSSFCPFVIEAADIIRAALGQRLKGVRLLRPTLALRYGRRAVGRDLRRFGRELGAERRAVRRAVAKAWEEQDDFARRISRQGSQALAALGPDETGVVVVGRSYNTYDPGVNMNLPQKLRELGALPIPIGYLPLDEADTSGEWPDMYWLWGQRILAAGAIIANDPRLQAAYLSNFQCGPDSFIIRLFGEAVSPKSFLLLEIDEHSADAGVVTRVEAFLDSLRNADHHEEPRPARRPRRRFTMADMDGRTLYLPKLGDMAYAVEAAARAAGIPTEVVPPSDHQTLTLGRRHTSGRECYPCIVTTGDMVKLLEQPDVDPDKVAFLMPRTQGPCRFGLYNSLQRRALDAMGYEDTPILSPDQAGEFYKEIGGLKVAAAVWRGIVAVDCLNEAALRIRPYEREKGRTDAVFDECLQDARGALGAGARDVLAAAERSCARFAAIETDGSGVRPRIGIVGEIFVRNHTFSNRDLIRRIEDLGGEVVTPVSREWLHHINALSMMEARMEGRYARFLAGLAVDRAQRVMAWRIRKRFDPLLGPAEYPTVAELWDKAAEYVISWFNEAALSIGGVAHWLETGRVDAWVNVMPFGCMVGGIVNGMMKSLKERYGAPCMTMAYDGLEQPTTETTLLTFMHGARQAGSKSEIKRRG